MGFDPQSTFRIPQDLGSNGVIELQQQSEVETPVVVVNIAWFSDAPVPLQIQVSK
jgi:hypothetical protein